MKRIILALLICSASLLAAQSDNTVYVKQFPGADVGTKITNAMATCSSNTSIPCILVLDPSLAAYNSGTIPSLCSNCYLQDWRAGQPTNGAMPMAGGTFSGPTNQVGPVYNVMLHGAKCDGTTDDSTALQNTINAAQASGAPIAVVWVPPSAVCNFSTTLQLSGLSTSSIWIEGGGAKLYSQPANDGGSGLQYTGTGDGILVENQNTSNPTYNVSITDLFIGCTASCTNAIHAYGLNGPARLERLIVNGAAANQSQTSIGQNGITCVGCSIQVSISDDFVWGFLDHGVELDGGGPVLLHHDQFFAIGYDTTGVRGVGVYASAVNGLTIDGQTYFELMPTGIEIANDQENYGQYVIRDDDFFIGESGSPTSYNNTSNQRCIRVKSSTNGFPLYFQAEISHNQCHVGPGFSQGLSSYALESDTSTNTFYVSGQLSFEDNQVDGMVTAAFYADSSKVTTSYRNNISRTLYTVGSVAPVYLPQVAGSGIYDTPTIVPSASPMVTVSGTVTGSGTSASHSFSTAFSSAPQCAPTPTSSSGAFYVSAQSASAFAITYATSGAQTFQVSCTGPVGGVW